MRRPTSDPLRGAARRGFTLLEVMLASALAIILMAALYVALDVQLKMADAGREAIEQATVTRALVQRFETDLAGCLGPVAPAIGAAAATTATGEAAEDDPEAMAAAANASIPFQAGVIGEAGDDDSGKLTLFVCRVAGLGAATDGVVPADVRRVTFWMTEKGLARQEVPWVTSERLRLSTDLYFEDGQEADQFVIAEEVKKVQFAYWDGAAWAEIWDGRQLAADGVSLKGPPTAVRVSFWMTVPGQEAPKEFRHTISLLAGPGPAVPETPSGM